MGNLTAMWESLRNWWMTAPPQTKAIATGLAIFVIVGLYVAGVMAMSPDYQPIYKGVSGREASEIEKVLTEHSIPMRFGASDGSVSVPSKDQSAAKMYIEAAGVVGKNSNIVGMESLDKIGLGTSSAVERERILYANQGELEKTLMQLSPVDMASVKINPGTTSSLFSNDVSPSASVILTLKPGQELTSVQKKGIAGIVQHAINSKNPQDVEIVDQDGNPLWKADANGYNTFDDTQQLGESQKYAETIRKNLQSMLDTAFGIHKTIIRVNAELDFDQKQTHEITHSPVPGTKNGLPLSIRDKNESYVGAGMPGTSGIPGASSNTGGPQSYTSNGVQSTSSGTYKNNETVTNYDNNTEETNIQKSPGSIRKLTVAAMVDSAVNATDIPKIKDIIAATIGVMPGEASRYVNVQQFTFDTSALKAQSDQSKNSMSQAMWTNIARIIGICIVAIILLYMLMKTSRPLEEPRLTSVGTGSNIGLLGFDDLPEATLEGIHEERPLRVEDVLAEMPEVLPHKPKRRHVIPSIEEQHDIKMESIQDMINTNTEAVALLLKGWMAEEQSKFPS